MSVKITQCMLLFFLQNKQTLFQVFNCTSPNNLSKNSYSTRTKKKNQKKNFFEKHLSNKKFSLKSCGDQNDANLSAVLHGPKDLKLEDRLIPKIGSNQVLLQIEVVGLCRSDIRIYENGKIGPWLLKKPLVVGRESSATVVECGECVKDLKPGNKVAIEPQLPCRMCRLCKTGKYNLCRNLEMHGIPPVHGSLSRFFVHDSDFCHKFPCHLDHDLSALMEPLSHAVHACKRARISSGDSVLILGSDALGILTMLAARAYGASTVVVLGIDTYQLKKTMEMGADCAINCHKIPEQEVVKRVHEIVGHPPNKTLDCCGFQATLRIGILATGSSGTVVLLAPGDTNQSIPIMDSLYRQIDIKGVRGSVNDFETAIDMVASGKVNPRPVISHHFKLEDVCKAFDMASKGEQHMKIMVHVNPKWKPNNYC